ncbi:uncharacterized protein LOC129732462 isoform X2 [Wyeomyia smithii]|uniref:uncharacterized protein LOC129732462 isoform X2 n=1 Tax=Wyeomyia smithii TaxID=174621 RepID=UPI002467F4B1|nr:uncharacterized protein LOC129732462 isoform X2 [Wyeomyia smithii]
MIRKIILLLFILSTLIIITASYTCYECTNCSRVVDFDEVTTECDACAVWEEEDGSISRGCYGDRDILHICMADHCNVQHRPVCQRCRYLDDCETVICEFKDECYISNDESRGCTSDEDYDSGDESLKTCSEDLCNKVASCIVCNSLTPEHQDCLTNPEKFRQHCTLHGIYGENNCFRQEVNENEFHLGCTSEFGTPDCVESPSDTCKTCADEYCNQKAFPSCYICNDCRTIAEENPPVDYCVDYYDKCYTAYDHDTKLTKRGCSDGLVLEDIFETFEPCSDVNCNGKEFPVHLRCHQCDSCDHSGPSDYCRSTQAEKCFTLLLDEVVIRGCDTDSQFEQCTEDSKCEICRGDNCNAEKNCYKCDDCLTVDEETEKCYSLLGCYTLQSLDSDLQISRGCVEDENFKNCVDGINCRTCVGNDCNVDETRTVPLVCSFCSGLDCGDYSPPKNCTNSVGRLIDLCVDIASVLTGLIFKGCFSDGIPEEFELDCYTNKRFCETCESDYCNTPVLQCLQCSTTEQGIDCIVNPELINSEDCQPGDACATGLDDKGHIHRGCATKVSCDGPHCELCDDKHKCNTAVIPTTRSYCYQCAGDENCLSTNNLEPSPCITYDENDFCFTLVKDSSTVYRGCMSDEFKECTESIFCIPCNGEIGCNNQEPTIPNALSCIHCDGDSECRGMAFGTPCEKQQLLGRVDQCYTLKYLDLEIEKGCLSDLSIESSWYSDCLENNDKCSTCSDPLVDCNRGHSLCHKCNSKDDVDCSQIVNKEYVTQCEAECVSILNDGYTIRDCIEAFEGLDVSECDSLPHCHACTTKKCNNEIVHEDHLMCYQCMGSEDDCLNAEDWHNKACPRYLATDACYTHFNSTEWVARGCLSNKEDGSCIDDCKACSAKGCNKQEALQPNTLTCISCEGDDCDGIKVGTSCSEEVLLGRQDYCYTYEDEQSLQKGCVSDLKTNDKIREACENNPAKCSICGHSDCNGDFHYCVTCDSKSHPECGGWIKVVPPELTVDCADKKCVSYIDDSNTTWKGCAELLEPCDSDDPTCRECTGSMCNNVAFPDDRILCHQCEACNQLPSTQLPVACPEYQSNESCYTYMIDDIIYRGCSSMANINCDQFEDICLTCDVSGCNDEPKQHTSTLSCIQCYGEDECAESTQPIPCEGSISLGEEDQCFTLMINDKTLHKGCARFADIDCNVETCDYSTCKCNGCNLRNSKLSSNKCIVCNGEGCGAEILAAGSTCDDDICITYMSREGAVSRGCLEDFSDKCSVYGNRHETCIGALCNANLFPADRIKCHRCNDCAESIPETEICPRYVEGDGCFTSAAANGTEIRRGCLSELSSVCSEPNCLPCYSSGCNNEIVDDPICSTSTTDPTLVTNYTCINCEESSDNERCAWGYQSEMAERCSSDDVDCFTCSVDDLIIRGCSTDENLHKCSNGSIHICSESGCNNESQKKQYCAICDDICDGRKQSFSTQQCSGNIEFGDRGCYVLKDDSNVIIQRGCVASLENDIKEECLKGSTDKCKICYPDGCNVGHSLEALNRLIVTAVFVLVTLKLV